MYWHDFSLPAKILLVPLIYQSHILFNISTKTLYSAPCPTHYKNSDTRLANPLIHGTGQAYNGLTNISSKLFHQGGLSKVTLLIMIGGNRDSVLQDNAWHLVVLQTQAAALPALCFT